MGRAIKSGQMPGKTGGRMKLNEQSCMGVQGCLLYTSDAADD